MAQEFSNQLRGVLFKNDRKEKDSHPDYKGSCEVEGIEYWMSAWVKVGQKGKFMSLSFQVKEQAKNPPARVPTKPSKAPKQDSYGFDDMDDEQPF